MRDAEPIEMGAPGDPVGEEPVGMFSQTGDHRPGEGTLAHGGQRLGIDDIIAMAGAQQAEEVAAALGVRGAEPGEVCVADLRAEAVRGLVASAGVVDRDPGSARQGGAQHIAVLRAEAVLAGDRQRRMSCRLEMMTPNARSSASSRATVTCP